MDYIRAILDGIAIAAIFNGAVAALALINPRYFFDSGLKRSKPTKKRIRVGFITLLNRLELESRVDKEPLAVASILYHPSTGAIRPYSASASLQAAIFSRSSAS